MLQKTLTLILFFLLSLNTSFASSLSETKVNELLNNYLDAWKTRDINEIGKLYAENVSVYDLPTDSTTKGKKAVLKFEQEAWLASAPDMVWIKTSPALITGNTVAYEWVYSGTYSGDWWGTKVDKKPVRWDMKEMLVMSGWLGIAGVLSSFALFFYTIKYLNLPLDLVQSIFFTKLVIAGHGTIYNTRTDEWFWKKPFPSLPLNLAIFSTAIIGTVIAVYGFGLMTPVGWKWGLFLWGYAAGWFLFNDMVKRAVIRHYRKRLKK